MAFNNSNQTRCDLTKAIAICNEVITLVNNRSFNTKVHYHATAKAYQSLIDDIRRFHMEIKEDKILSDQLVFYLQNCRNYFSDALKYNNNHINIVKHILEVSCLPLSANELAQNIYTRYCVITKKKSYNTYNNKAYNYNKSKDIKYDESEQLLLAIIFIMMTSGGIVKEKLKYEWVTKSNVLSNWNILTETENIHASFNSLFTKLKDKCFIQKHSEKNEYIINKINIIDHFSEWTEKNENKLNISQNNIFGIDDEFKQFNHVTSLNKLEQCKYILVDLENMGFSYESIVVNIKRFGNNQAQIVSSLVNDNINSFSTQNIQELELKTNSPNCIDLTSSPNITDVKLENNTNIKLENNTNIKSENDIKLENNTNIKRENEIKLEMPKLEASTPPSNNRNKKRSIGSAQNFVIIRALGASGFARYISCKKCTFNNQQNATQCEMCETNFNI